MFCTEGAAASYSGEVKMLRFVLKTVALAGIVGLGIAASAAPAAARTYVRCDYEGDRCVRVHCDWDGDDCWRGAAYFNRSYYRGGGRWGCDENRDGRHWGSYH